MKFLAIVASLAAMAEAACAHPHKPHYRTTKMFGVEVIDTDIVRDARATIRNFDGFLYKHSMRTWLFGAAALNANQTLKDSVDVELHAVSTILHDLGWDMTPGSPWISPDKRFEIDGALGAVKFVKGHKDAKKWDEYRLEKLHDGIALHGSPGLAAGKNKDVANILSSIAYDNPGSRNPAIPEKDYNAILKGLPADDIGYGTNLTWVWLAETKPEATYNTIVEPFGTAFVPGYSAIGHRVFDLINPGFSSQA
ncbi:hypothetical protein F5B22DRAFT_630315 [Xylaria bambusicola]|uniref:uncharacterized protein n=1 Tax=Xylaria bambusicola TaxID=326684 RepID=UPI00200827AA|nr:uncharacterized protein F5B22DRAFT_630315 [Xylaria bambusicola]KAI0503142.1 hypothetical protein F5B22DRAFT_630315 [Xylaria bambusicola]